MTEGRRADAWNWGGTDMTPSRRSPVDSGPGDVWTDAQVGIIRDLILRLVQVEAKLRAVEELDLYPGECDVEVVAYADLRRALDTS